MKAYYGLISLDVIMQRRFSENLLLLCNLIGHKVQPGPGNARCTIEPKAGEGGQILKSDALNVIFVHQGAAVSTHSKARHGLQLKKAA